MHLTCITAFFDQIMQLQPLPAPLHLGYQVTERGGTRNSTDHGGSTHLTNCAQLVQDRGSVRGVFNTGPNETVSRQLGKRPLIS
jgi:hypothetical protein